MKHLGSVTDIHGGRIAPVDIITFGSPCQDLSVAGKRAGLEGARSGLFNEAVRIIHEMQSATNGEYPKVCIWENVPGAFSSNGSKDIESVLDSMEELGFVVDMTVLDAQNMGVPQRRRRIFAVWVSVNYILQNKTIISVSIITQLIIEILQYVLVEQLRASGIELLKSDYPLKKDAKDGLLRRMRLFGIKTEENWLILLENLAETLTILLIEHKSLESHLGTLIIDLQRDMQLEDHQTRTANEKRYSDILKLWKNIWEEAYSLANSSTTSTLISNTTQLTIYTCSLLGLSMAELIVQLSNSYQDFYNSESLLLTVTKECMNYARQSSSNLFTELEWVQRWNDYLDRASNCTEQLERHFGGECAGEILFVEQSLSGDSPEGRKAREEVAACVGDGVETTVNLDQTSDRITINARKSVTLKAGGGGGGAKTGLYLLPIAFNGRQDHVNGPVIGALDTDRATQCIAIQHSIIGRKDEAGAQGPGFRDDGKMFTLDSRGAAHAVAQCVTTGTGRRYDPETETLIPVAYGPGGQHEITHTLRSQASKADKPSSTTYVVEPIVFAQNQRDEVRDLKGKAGALAAEPGMKQQTFVAQPTYVCKTDQTGSNGLGICEEVAYTLDLAGGQAVAYPAPANTLLAKANMSHRGDTDNIVIEPKGSEIDGNADERNTIEILRALRKEIGEEAFSKWGHGILASLQQEEVLQSKLYGRRVQKQAEDRNGQLEDKPRQIAEIDSPRSLFGVWQAECAGCSPQGRGLDKQRTGEFRETLPELPQLKAQSEEILLNMREASKGIRILRQALSEVQEVRRSDDGQSKPVFTGYAVRRLTPLEAERLQGLPDGWTNIPGASDTAKYKAIGNGLAIPCVEWIMRRITEVLGLKTLGSLFDGLAGFPLAGQRAGIKTLWASEIELFCIRVSQKHFPEVTTNAIPSHVTQTQHPHN